jgi:hypothetical protein
MPFSCTIFPVKKINVGKILKSWENRYLIILSIHILKLEISECDNLHSCRLQTLPQEVAETSSPLAVRLEWNPRSFRHLHNVVRGLLVRS